jgi:hypothetical protein
VRISAIGVRLQRVQKTRRGLFILLAVSIDESEQHVLRSAQRVVAHL